MGNTWGRLNFSELNPPSMLSIVNISFTMWLFNKGKLGSEKSFLSHQEALFLCITKLFSSRIKTLPALYHNSGAMSPYVKEVNSLLFL